MADKEDREENTGPSDAQLQEELTARNATVTQLLNKKDKQNALIACLNNPPVGAKSNDIKVNYNLVLLN